MLGVGPALKAVVACNLGSDTSSADDRVDGISLARHCPLDVSVPRKVRAKQRRIRFGLAHGIYKDLASAPVARDVRESRRRPSPGHPGSASRSHRSSVHSGCVACAVACLQRCLVAPRRAPPSLTVSICMAAARTNGSLWRSQRAEQRIAALGRQRFRVFRKT